MFGISRQGQEYKTSPYGTACLLKKVELQINNGLELLTRFASNEQAL